MRSGIYKILNRETGIYYIGSSKNLSYRWWRHKNNLNRGVHCNQYLQNSWNKHGKNTFEFIIVEEVDKDKLIEREQIWLNVAKNERDKIYNLTFIAGGGDTLTNHPNRLEILDKIRRAVSGELNGMFGRKHSEETKKKWSVLRKGQFSGYKHPQYGKHLSDETKLKLAGIQSKILWKFLSPQGTVLEIRNLAEFCRKNGLDKGAMGKVASGKTPHHKRWKSLMV